MSLSPTLIAELTQLRQTLHQHPELSGAETNTAQRIVQFVSRYAPDEIITNLGGNGIAIIYRGHQPGPTVMIRADLDALPQLYPLPLPNSQNQPSLRS